MQKIFFNYEPRYENEVCLLFGFIMPYLKNEWILDEYSGSFPDAIFLIDGKETRVEFEVFSTDFLTHKHDENKCDVIVCWKDNWPGCRLRIIELSKEMCNVGLNKIIRNKGTKYKQILNIGYNHYYEHLTKYNDANIVKAIREFITTLEKDKDLILKVGKGSEVEFNLNICIRKFRPHNTFIGLTSNKNGFYAFPWFKLLKG
jgi:hypothetical protein